MLGFTRFKLTSEMILDEPEIFRSMKSWVESSLLGLNVDVFNSFILENKYYNNKSCTTTLLISKPKYAFATQTAIE